MRQFLFITILILLSFNSFCLEVTLTQGTIKPTPIAVTEFFSEESSSQKIGKNISQVISENLERSGLFISGDNKYLFFFILLKMLQTCYNKNYL